MTWVKFDDQFNNHPKVIAAGPLAIALHMRAIVYCGQYFTDGFIHKRAVRNLIDWSEDGVTVSVTRYKSGKIGKGDTLASPVDLPDNEMLAERLVDVGLWHQFEDGYKIHDYLDYNFSKSEMLAKREKTLERVKRHRKRKRNAVTNAESNDVTNANRNGGVTASPTPTPTPYERERDRENCSTTVTALQSPYTEKEIKANAQLEISKIEQLGFEKYGELGGTSIQHIRKLCPISGQEFLDAYKSKGKSWKYFAKVIESIRDNKNNIKSNVSPKKNHRFGYHPGDDNHVDYCGPPPPIEELNG